MWLIELGQIRKLLCPDSRDNGLTGLPRAIVMLPLVEKQAVPTGTTPEGRMW